MEYHGTTTVFCEIDKNPYSWIYLPDTKYDAHRIICTGNFSATNNVHPRSTGSIEFTDEKKYDSILEQLSPMPLHPRYITHKYNRLTYPIQHSYTRKMIAALQDHLHNDNLFLCGRFAEWEYYNMDKAMESALKVACQEFNIAF